MNKLTVFFAVFAVLAVSVSARVHLDKTDEDLQTIAAPVKKGESSSEELDLTKLSDADKTELREWAKTVDITWEQIEALSEFQQDVKGNPTGEKKKQHIDKVCKAFDREPKEDATAVGKTKEEAAVAQMIQLLSLYQQLLTVKEDRQVFVLLKSMCHIVNGIQAQALKP